jgi:hypothetical protein
MKRPLASTPLLLLALWSLEARAETPQQVLEGLVAQAGSPSPSRGEQLFRGRFSGGKSADSCTACHTPDPKAYGRHIKTHKVIKPIAPVANRDRFTDLANVEKWFRRNCPEVLGRACSAQEKADFVAYMISVK